MGAHFLCIFDPCHNFFIFMACWLKIALQNGMFVTGRYLSVFIFVINCAISGWITGGIGGLQGKIGQFRIFIWITVNLSC
jgi:hypothetical protein